MSDNYTPKTELEQQYEREYKRITQAIRRQEKLGYFVPEAVKPTPPSKVKVMAPSKIDELIKLTPKEIRKKSVWVDQDTGEAHQGLDIVNSHHKAKPSTAKISQHNHEIKQKEIAPQVQRKKRKIKKKPEDTAPPIENNFNMQIIDDITNMLRDWTPASYWNTSYTLHKATMRETIMDKWLTAIEREGAYQLAYRLENKAEYYRRTVDRVIHFSDSPFEDSMNLNEIITFLTGQALTAEESDRYASQAYDRIRDSIIGDSFG